MIVFLDTSTPECYLSMYDEGTWLVDVRWQANRTLAHGLLKFIQDHLSAHDKTWDDISALAVFKGPGSFTGLRIGIAVVNTVADTMQIPIVGTTGDDWREQAIERLTAHEDDKLVSPLYGRDANITTPRK